MAKRKFPNFLSLWSSYPTEQKPCDQGWDNQCAIRMSVCLINAGFHLTKYTEPKCKHGHARGAESLANYLWQQVGPPKIAVTVQTPYWGKGARGSPARRSAMARSR